MSQSMSFARTRALLAVALGCALAALPGAQAQAAETHGAHVHGVGKLNVALEGDGVWLEIEAPASDIVGFEHPPETPEQEAAVDRAAATLQNAAGLFVFPDAARCASVEATVESALLDHDDDHDHVAKHDDDHDAAGHAEFHARYVFRCGAPAEARHVDIGYFAAFPAAQELEVTMISPSGQTTAELTPSSSRLKF